MAGFSNNGGSKSSAGGVVGLRVGCCVGVFSSPSNKSTPEEATAVALSTVSTVTPDSDTGSRLPTRWSVRSLSPRRTRVVRPIFDLSTQREIWKIKSASPTKVWLVIWERPRRRIATATPMNSMRRRSTGRRNPTTILTERVDRSGCFWGSLPVRMDAPGRRRREEHPPTLERLRGRRPRHQRRTPQHQPN